MSPSPEQIEYAEMLDRLARGDLYACRKLADDAEIDDHIIGFHAQQAVEKPLKVALVLAVRVLDTTARWPDTRRTRSVRPSATRHP